MNEINHLAGTQADSQIRPTKCVRAGLERLASRIRKLISVPAFASLESRHEIEISYFGRVSDFLVMTTERMVVPDKTYTLEQVLNELRKRSGVWAYELDDSHIFCEINSKAAMLSDPIEAGFKVGIYSTKSIFER